MNSFKLPNGRGNIIIKNGYKIIDESYNANPASMKLGLKRISRLENFNNKIIIIGDMLELGKQKLYYHEKLGNIINSLNIDIVFTFGNYTKVTHETLNKNYKYKRHFNNMVKMKKELKNIIEENDIIFIKGSRSIKLERIYN